MSLLFTVSIATAGEIILVSENWDTICTLEVATGLNAPENPDSTEEFRRVRSEGGIVFTGFDRLCYRRSLIPDDCYTSLNEWSCYTNTTSEPEIVYIY